LAVKIMNYWDVDKMPVFMAATPDFVRQEPDVIVKLFKAWLEVAKDFKNEPNKSDAIYSFYTPRVTRCRRRPSASAGHRGRRPGLPPT